MKIHRANAFQFVMSGALLCWKQLLHKEAAASEAEWDHLNQAVSSLRDVISPAAAVLLTEQLDGQRGR